MLIIGSGHVQSDHPGSDFIQVIHIPYVYGSNVTKRVYYGHEYRRQIFMIENISSTEIAALTIMIKNDQPGYEYECKQRLYSTVGNFNRIISYPFY